MAGAKILFSNLYDRPYIGAKYGPAGAVEATSCAAASRPALGPAAAVS